MKIQHHILDASNVLSPYRELLDSNLECLITQISDLLPVRALDICVSNFPEGTNPELGIGGSSYTESLLHIFLDANNPNLQSSIESELAAVLAHEMHHSARLAEIPLVETLGEKFVIEGLACQFEKEITGEERPSFIPLDLCLQWQEHFANSLPVLNSTDFCEETWFLGKDPDQKPKYTGYAIGFGVVGEYLRRTKLSAAQAYAVPAEDIFAIVNG